MPSARDLVSILAWGAPGLTCLVASVMAMLAEAVRTRTVSPLGARLRFIGLGLLTLGWLAELELSLVARHAWSVALLALLLVGWAPAVAFWLARQVRGSDAAE